MSLADLIIDNLPLPSLSPSLTSYEKGHTPLSTWPGVLLAVAGYLAVIFGIQKFMGPRKPFKLTALSRAHNLILCLGSFVLLVLIVEEIAPIVLTRGMLYGICAKGSWTSKLEFYYMINYCFKYFEFLDTLFLVLKKKPLTFLHVFHHAATAVICFAQMNSKPSISWVPITLNLTVHVAMYYYYYATSTGRKIWWKKHLTTMQIGQFIIDLFAFSFASYAKFWSTLRCTGDVGIGLFGIGLFGSYLLLFLSFYKDTYEKSDLSKAELSLAREMVMW